jgi:hypothetical protein
MYRTTAVDTTISLCTGTTYDNTSVVESGAEEPKFYQIAPRSQSRNYQLGPRLLSIYHRLTYRKKIMIAEEVFVIYYLPYIFNPITEVKKGNFKRYIL